MGFSGPASRDVKRATPPGVKEAAPQKACSSKACLTQGADHLADPGLLLGRERSAQLLRRLVRWIKQASPGGAAEQSQAQAARFQAMSERARGVLWLLVSFALVGCAAVPPGVREEEAGCEQEGATFEQVCQQEGTLVAVCEGGQCAAYRCREVAEYLQVGQVVRARWVRPPQPPGPPSPQTRREVGSAWSGPQAVPQPVLIIPWNSTAQPLLPPGKVKVLESQEPLRGNPYERHHIYPQEEATQGVVREQGHQHP